MPHHFGTMKLKGRGAWLPNQTNPNNTVHNSVASTMTGMGGERANHIVRGGPVASETYNSNLRGLGIDGDARPNYWKQTRPTPMPMGLGLIPVEHVIRGPSIKRGEGLTSDAIKRLESLRPKPIQKPNIKFNL